MTTLDTAPQIDSTGNPEALWYTRCPVPTASGIAQNRRWLQDSFASIGVRLDSVIASADRAVRENHFRHTLPGSFREGGNVPPIWAKAQGTDTVVVAITWVDEEQLLLVRPDSGITTGADLRGRRIGVVLKEQSDLVDVGRAESLRGSLTSLEVSGVGRDEVTWVDVRGPEWDLKERDQSDEPERHLLVQALLDDEVDAVFIKGAHVSAALAEGLVPVVNLNESEDPFVRISAGSPRPVTVDRATLEQHPDLVDRYLAVLLRTAEWARENPEATVETIAAETGTDPDAVRRAFGASVNHAFTPQLSEVYVEALRRQKDWLLAEGFLADDVDLDAWIDRAPLERAIALAPSIELGA